MPGFTNNTKGSAGAVANTTFFSLLADKLTMLVPGHYSQAGDASVDGTFAADNVNKWTIGDNTWDAGGGSAATVSLGSLTTAPDGTNTAQKIVETTTTNTHAMISLMVLSDTTDLMIRVAFFAKAAERTRCALEISNHNSRGIVTVFDLAGAQIGVAATLTGSAVGSWIVGPSACIPYGNGWCLCRQDVKMQSGSINAIQRVKLMIDNGSGTAAQSTTYTGDVTKGIYTWKASALPARSWNLNTVTYFEDFLDLSMIDVNNTRTGDFMWWVNNTWPQAGFHSPATTPSVAAQFSTVGGTILRIESGTDHPGGSHDACSMMTAVNVGAANGNTNQYHSSSKLPLGGFVPPFCVEYKARWNTSSGFQHVAFWGRSLNNLMDDGTTPTGLPLTEDDWWEAGVQGSPVPQCSFTVNNGVGGVYAFSSGEVNYKNPAVIGYSLWTATTTWPAGSRVFWPASPSGVPYDNTSGGNSLNQQPDLNPGVWTPANVVPQGYTTNSSSGYNDVTNFNTYAVIWMPATPDDAGFQLSFMNGVACVGRDVLANMFIYSPTNHNKLDSEVYHTSDATTITLIAGPGIGAGCFQEIDFCRITQ